MLMSMPASDHSPRRSRLAVEADGLLNCCICTQLTYAPASAPISAAIAR